MGLTEKFSPLMALCRRCRLSKSPAPSSPTQMSAAMMTPAEQKRAEAEEVGSTVGRAQWASPTEFMLTCIGYSVGLGNVWRFPYLCYKNGGGAFLIPYMIMICLIGMPMLFMEYAFGQYFGIGSLSIFKKICPMFQGIGIGYIVLNALVCIYYNVIIALALYYLFGSFQANLPWASCDNAWNTKDCGDPNTGNGTAMSHSNDVYGATSQLSVNGTGPAYTASSVGLLANVTSAVVNHSARVSPADEYFRLQLLNTHAEHSISNLGDIRWHLCLCLLLAWVLVVLFVSRGIKSTGKVAYFTATFPYVMLTVLVVRGVTLPGASSGILYFITPDWSKLGNPEIWFEAATQLFYSTNLAWGGMITMSSYNTFSHNCLRDAIMINLVSFFTSLYAGIAVFSIIGYMASEQGVHISHVIESGPGLAFIVYPRALSLMPLAPMWTALFFFMLFLLGVGSQMVLMETVVSGFADEFPLLARSGSTRFLLTVAVAVVFLLVAVPNVTQMVQVETILTGLVDKWSSLTRTWRARLLTAVVVGCIGFLLGLPCTFQMVDMETVMSGLCDEFPHLRSHRFLVLVGTAVVFFLVALPQVTQGGMYVLQLMDWYSAGFCVLVIAIVECVVINWVYGNKKFAANVKEMLGHYPARWWRICWKYTTPFIILCVLIFSFLKYKPAHYGDYVYPVWADTIGWFITLSSVIPIVIVVVVKYYRADGTTWRQKLKNATRPVISIEENHKVSMIDIDPCMRSAAPMPPLDGSPGDEREAQRKRLLVAEENGNATTGDLPV